MNVKEKAKKFSINAHKGQVRKSEPDKPLIIHPIGVAKLLEEYGCDDNVIAAGFLHDVVEDNKAMTNDIIRQNFGDDIADLVDIASEPDKSLSWETRKQHTIDVIKDQPLRTKMVICADKINNLDDLMLKFQKLGDEQKDFSTFNRGEDKQRWYYTEVYKSLIYGEDETLPIFNRLKDLIEIVFYDKRDKQLDKVFEGNEPYYKSLKKLHAQKLEIVKLKSLVKLPKPFVIEFCGTPRTGKTTMLNNLYDFFKKADFNIKLVEEFTTSKYYKEVFKKHFLGMPNWDVNIAIVEEVKKQLIEAVNLPDTDIVLIDRSINDRQIWNYRRYEKDNIELGEYIKYRNKYQELSKALIDALVITYADSNVSLKRDYLNSLSLEKRRFLNVPNIEEYNKYLQILKGTLSESARLACIINTSDKQINDVVIKVAHDIMVTMRECYIEAFNNEMDKYMEE